MLIKVSIATWVLGFLAIWFLRRQKISQNTDGDKKMSFEELLRPKIEASRTLMWLTQCFAPQGICSWSRRWRCCRGRMAMVAMGRCFGGVGEWDGRGEIGNKEKGIRNTNKEYE